MVTRKVRFAIFLRDKFTCQYCGRQAPEVVIEIDHVLPCSKGGTNDPNNLVTACRDCNRGKSESIITPNIENYEATLAKYDQELQQVVSTVNRWGRDECMASEYASAWILTKVKNKKIKKIKYILEYIDHQTGKLSESDIELKQKYLKDIFLIKHSTDFDEILSI